MSGFFCNNKAISVGEQVYPEQSKWHRCGHKCETCWKNERDIVIVRAPEVDIRQVCGLVIDDVLIEIPAE